MSVAFSLGRVIRGAIPEGWPYYPDPEENPNVFHMFSTIWKTCGKHEGSPAAPGKKSRGTPLSPEQMQAGKGSSTRKAPSPPLAEVIANAPRPLVAAGGVLLLIGSSALLLLRKKKR